MNKEFVFSRLLKQEVKILKKDRYGFEDLLEIMRILRSEKGCPWDREQDHESLKKYLIEECYEVLEAIDLKNSDKLCEELGDLFLQAIFHSQIADENKDFNIYDVVDGISKKLVSRHVHVFGSDRAETADDVVDKWEAIKKEEKGFDKHSGMLKDVPPNLPALMRSYKVQQKASQVGFDWDNIEDVFKKVHEELDELKEVYLSKNVERIKDELGDLLFSVVNISRFLKVQPEIALTGTVNKFIRRFEYVEKKAGENNRELTDMSLDDMDVFWEESKKHL